MSVLGAVKSHGRIKLPIRSKEAKFLEAADFEKVRGRN
jgi:hypothetical protein